MYNLENYFYLKSSVLSFISISDTLLLFYIFFNICNFIIFVIFILLSIAFFTVFERKLMAAFQKRKGPNIHGFWGFLQAFADGLKLLLKEDFVPSNSNILIFRISPIFTFFLSLASWAIIPFFIDTNYSTPSIGILYIFALSALSVYGIILSGWASNSKYAFLGSLRSAAQMISYEVSIGFILIGIIYSSGSLDLRKIIYDQAACWYLFKLFPLFLLFFISAIAETNRAPFDLPEAEAELVSGYNVEYGGISFALFFLAEYGSIILMSTLTTILFLGGWHFIFTNIFLVILFFVLKIQFIVVLFVWIRVAFPRYRYDQLMALGWKVFLPLSMAFIIFFALLNIVLDLQAPLYTSVFCDLELAKVSPNEAPVLLSGTELEKRLVKGFFGEEGRHIFLFKNSYLTYTCEYKKIFSYILYPPYFKSDFILNNLYFVSMPCIKYINY